MKLSEQTIGILKNFATINPSVLIKAGNVMSTMSPQKTIIAKATVEESFPQQFAIYELAKFLGVLSLFKEPELEFSERQVMIRSGKQSVNYTYADPSMIVAPPERDIVFPEADVEFNITQEQLQRVVRAAGVLQLPEIAVTGDGHIITVTATSSKNPTTDVFCIEVGETTNSFSMIFEVDNIVKLIQTDYNVKISSKGLSQFTANNILYYVATKANSTFKGE